MINAWNAVWSFISGLFECLALIMPIFKPLLRAGANVSGTVELESQIMKVEREIELAEKISKKTGTTVDETEYWKTLGIPVPTPVAGTTTTDPE